MTEMSSMAVSGTMVVEEVEGGGAVAGGEQASAPGPRPLCCALWPRPQTWLCAVPLLIGCIGLGLSLMLLNWIVVGSVQDYMPTDLVDNKGVGQDPIFLSKPSAVPKSPHATTTTNSSPTEKPRPRPGTHPTATPSATPSATPGRRTPHLHNRISTRLTTTTTHMPHPARPAGGDVTPRSTTVRRFGPGNGPSNARNGAPSSTRAAPPISSPSPNNHNLLHNSTHVWTHERSSKGPAVTPTRPHLHVKTVAPTSPSLRSEHFKPCRDKDLAYCLNEGECFVIQTLTGSHKHCRCKEGYQGIRCDQFLPKTDSILSDPTDNLGIEFMESKDIYKGQIFSISCIAIGISLLGLLCIAVYSWNKKRREKLEANLKVSCSLKSPKVDLAPVQPVKTGLRLQYGLRLQKHCIDPGSSPPHDGAVCERGFPQRQPAPQIHPKAPPTHKQSWSNSSPNSPGQRSRAAHHRATPRRTPPISRGRLNPIGGFRDSSHSYQHLQEVEGPEREVQPVTGCSCSRAGSGPLQDRSADRQQGPRREDRWINTEMQFSRLDRATPFCKDPPASSLRARSVPIIPSFQEHDVTSCMQRSSLDRKRSSPQGSRHAEPPVAAVSGAPQRDQEEDPQRDQEVGPRRDKEKGPGDRLRALPHTHRKQNNDTDNLQSAAADRAMGGAQNELPESQLVDLSSPVDYSRGSAQPCQ
ncbi:hypothetical protein AGOR_G00203950 [Albula goreensis]|uniref:Pro-neuregulin-3, membrane-bound isoform n=1 Tax=Albula goreensis TaxID=1534307 RepID=A0A8T3CTC7_9TELE|nr:hypothetical protein AGOR_G00203950 [Albula goreensis]